MIDIPPHIRLLMKAEEKFKTVDFMQDAGLPSAVTVRHSRNRNAVRFEKPSLSIIFVGDDPQPNEQDRNAWEVVRELVFDIQVDLDLTTEISDEDPTGLLFLSRTVAAAVKALKDSVQPIFLDGLCDWIAVGSIDPEERSQPDIGRMTRALTVLYRVRSDDANVLLSAGENG